MLRVARGGDGEVGRGEATGAPSRQPQAAGGPSGGGPPPDGDHALTLDTSCSCGHPRRAHAGLRMEARDRCLECGCGEFSQAVEGVETSEGTIARINATIERVERLIAAASALLAERRPG